jgi:hypothetical protein
MRRIKKNKSENYDMIPRYRQRNEEASTTKATVAFDAPIAL